MRTTRDAIAKDWLTCPEAGELVDLRLSFSDCLKDHSCTDRSSVDCPLYVQRLVKIATGERAAANARAPAADAWRLQSPLI